MDITSVLVVFCLVSAVITYGLGLSVYARNPGSATNRLFLLSMLAASYWAAGEFMIWQSAGYEAVRFWLRASSFWTLSIVLIFHFVLAFTRHPLAERRNLGRLLAFLYLPAFVISLLDIFTDSLYTVVAGPGGEYIYVAVTDSPAYLAMSLVSCIIIVSALYIGITAWMRQEPGRVRQQNLLICIGIGIVILSGTMSAFVLPVLGIHLPNTVFIGIVCFSCIIGYAMIRQGLFTITPESAAPDIIRILPDGLILADRAGRIVLANASAKNLLRAMEDEPAGQPLAAVLPGPAVETIGTAMQKQETLADLEAVLDTPEYRVVSIAASIIRDPAGEPAGTVLILHDITRRKSSERALRVAREKLSLLSQLTRHDITNLVTALSGYILLIAERNADPVSAEHIAACQGILRRINGHLQFSREYEEIGQHEPVWQPADALVSRAWSDLPVSGVAIEVRVPPVLISADPLTVKVMYNLLENALRHGGAGLSRILVTAAEQPGGELVVAVEDNGVGIPAGNKELIFEHGYGRNTGLGLTLSREILAVTDIRLVETGTPGNGARFELHVPPQSWRKP